MALKLFEYLAAGTAIVASDLPINEEVLVDRENALLYRADDPKALAQAIRTVLNDLKLARKISQNAAKDSRKYSYENRAKQIISFLKRNE